MKVNVFRNHVLNVLPSALVIEDLLIGLRLLGWYLFRLVGYDVGTYTTAVCTVTSHQEIWVQVEFHPFGRSPHIGVVHIVRILSVDTVHTRYGNVLLPI